VDPALARRRHTLGPRRFRLLRDRDATGVSGTGHIADGVLWNDGTAEVRWLGDWPTTQHHDRGHPSIHHIHTHGGGTRVEWLDSNAWVEGMDEDLRGVRCRSTNVAQDLCEQVDHEPYVRDLEASQADVGWLLEEVARMRAALAAPVPEQQPTPQDYGRLCTAYGVKHARISYLAGVLGSALAELERVGAVLACRLGPEDPDTSGALAAAARVRQDAAGTDGDSARVVVSYEIGRDEAERLVRAAGLDPEEVLDL
jgi:hypothetical protein